MRKKLMFSFAAIVIGALAAFESWLRLSEQFFRVAKWNVCRG
jgi:hypothetical protein